MADFLEPIFSKPCIIKNIKVSLNGLVALEQTMKAVRNKHTGTYHF